MKAHMPCCDLDEHLAQARAERIAAGRPIKAPPSCLNCIDEGDCENADICAAIAGMNP